MSSGDTLEGLLSARAGLVVDDQRRVDNMGELAARVAAGLHHQGVRRGDAVAFQLGNHVETIVVYRACWRLGAVAMALHSRMGIRERNDLLGRLSPALVIAALDDVRELDQQDDSHETIDAEPDDDAVVLFTAGSTGDPKGVRHTHRALAYKASLMVKVHGLTAADVVLMPAPLAHVSGLLNGVLVSGAAGMKTVLMDRWSPSAALQLIERERVSFMVGPPTFFVDLMDDRSFAASKVESLRLVSSGGAGVAPAFVDRASIALGARVKRAYGSTEAPTVATSLTSDDPALDRGFDGHAIGEAELRIVDGELQVRGPELFAGYLSEQDTRRAMTEDGWFRTGDLARIDRDGWLTITGRVKDIIIRAGENISVREVEETLCAHPDIADASVVGIPHIRLGEQVAAVVVSSTDVSVDDCRRWFDDRGVARFKAPEIVIRVQALPRLAAGKIDRAHIQQIVTPSPKVN